MTVATLERMLPSGRLSELDDSYVPDITHTQCKVFESAVRQVADPKFADDLHQMRLDAEREDLMAQVRRYLTQQVVDTMVPIRNEMQELLEERNYFIPNDDYIGDHFPIEDTRADIIPAIVLEPTPPIVYDEEEDRRFDTIFEVPPSKWHVRADALKRKVHRGLKWLRAH
jgi:hypothetical protein